MSRTYTDLLSHVIFSTKHRQALIGDDVQVNLYNYIGGIVREYGRTLHGIGGVSDHVHLLINLPPNVLLSDLVKNVKTGSTKWMKERGCEFAWQNGYAAFSVSQSNKLDVLRYINNQKEHHHNRTFQEEYILLLRKHGIDYDERYVFDSE